MVPEYYPASPKAIEIGLKSSAFDDAEQDFWQMELTQLRRQFAALVKPRFSANELGRVDQGIRSNHRRKR